MSADENPDREDVMDAADDARKAAREEGWTPPERVWAYPGGTTHGWTRAERLRDAEGFTVVPYVPESRLAAVERERDEAVRLRENANAATLRAECERDAARAEAESFAEQVVRMAAELLRSEARVEEVENTYVASEVTALSSRVEELEARLRTLRDDAERAEREVADGVIRAAVERGPEYAVGVRHMAGNYFEAVAEAIDALLSDDEEDRQR